MKVYRGLDSIDKPFNEPVVTIGNFDGVHLGHQKIFRKVIESKRPSSESIVITFHPHPLRVLAPERGLKLLTPLDEKIRLIGAIGIDVMILIDFNKDFSRLPAEVFIKDILIDRVGTKHLIVGHNYRFGKDKEGDTRLLRKKAKQYGYAFTVVRSLKINGQTVSSSRIRQLLSWGRVCEASFLLGRAYSISGRVIKGAGRGEKILNTPTANLLTENEIVPREGVYAVKVLLDGRLYNGVANIGKNPTFGGTMPSYEVHLFDFKGNLIGKDIRVYFVDRIRAERKFPDPEALKAQIQKDIETALFILNEHRVNIDLKL